MTTESETELGVEDTRLAGETRDVTEGSPRLFPKTMDTESVVTSTVEDVGVLVKQWSRV